MSSFFQGVIAIFEMVEFYGCASRLLLAHNNKLRPRAWLTIGRTLKKVSPNYIGREVWSLYHIVLLLSPFPPPLSQSPFITTIDVSYCALDEQTLTLLLRAVRANCGLKVLKMEGNNLTGKGTFILSKRTTGTGLCHLSNHLFFDLFISFPIFQWQP